jgi:competence protein ComEC
MFPTKFCLRSFAEQKNCLCKACMWFIAVIFILISLNPENGFFLGISDLVRFLHLSCLNFTPKSSYASFYAAIVCGEDISGAQHELLGFKSLGIYHLLVISGSHLVFLSVLIEKFLKMKRNSFLSLLVLGIFCLMTGFQPPVVRSFFSLLADTFQRRQKLYWTGFEVAFLSVCMTIAMNPTWRGSYSLLLSYTACLVLMFTGKLMFAKPLKLWEKAFLIYFLMFVFLLPLAPPNFLSVITNPLLDLYVGFLVFPLSFFTYVFHFLTPITDFFWKILFVLLAKLSPYLPQFELQNISKNYLWFFALTLNFYGIAREKKWFG